MSELLIVGAGPAGVTAALWAKTLSLSFTLIEGSPRAGGQLHWIHFHPGELPGVAEGDGASIAATMARQLAEAGGDLRFGVTATALEPPRGIARAAVLDAAGARYEAPAILVATGVRRRRLGVPGERELEDRGVSYSGTRDRERLAGRPVLVVGGGDAGFENAIILSAAGCEVTLAVRGPLRARREFRERVAADPRVTVLEDTQVTAILGDDAVRAARLEGAAGIRELPVAGVVVKIGTEPNTGWCAGVLDHDEEGHLRVDARGRTSMPGVWAAGDVTRPLLPSLSVAAGTAATAVADIRRTLRGE